MEASEDNVGTAVKNVTLEAGAAVEADLTLGEGGGGGNSGGCGATQALGNDKQKLNLLRLFRDQVLMKTAAGAQYVSLYYQHSPEVVTMLKKDTALQAEVKGCILSTLPVLTAMMAQGANANVTEAQLREMTACLEKIEAKASDSLQKDLGQLLRAIKIGDIFKVLKRP